MALSVSTNSPSLPPYTAIYSLIERHKNMTIFYIIQVKRPIIKLARSYFFKLGLYVFPPFLWTLMH
jgi:hypothetical protein